ncbi:hypothetical protein DFJ67_6570 [Asanoa ferruginea]|uniref:Uncharacterized protein n=1 Tax=Asanoa ferruginea TaxID=53367 RepID=A0A3D9ZTL5_9ACTN|nr:hypothetical protein [Asanoa ferruginea]REG00516.1 hypothetical protein DFJ67_6570 [Asanoa ferruginea]GIF47678.1 hypothetical protein Afe04nite_22170 [Asanoa ferruginea]
MRATRLIGVVACLLFAAACSPVQHQVGDAAPAGSPAPTVAAPTATAPTVTPTTPASTPSSTIEATRAPLLLGPAGYGALKIGMTEKQAKATGMLTPFTNSGCRIAYLRGFPQGKGAVFVSPTLGLIAINAWGTMKTPEGVRVGTSTAEMRRIYPKRQFVDGDGDYEKVFVKVSNQAVYRIAVNGGKVTELTLQHAHQDCYE